MSKVILVGWWISRADVLCMNEFVASVAHQWCHGCCGGDGIDLGQSHKPLVTSQTIILVGGGGGSCFDRFLETLPRKGTWIILADHSEHTITTCFTRKYLSNGRASYPIYEH